MDFTKKAKDELEERVNQIEDFIAEKGLGSARLQKAKKLQRNVNLAVFLGGVAVIAAAAWLVKRNN